MQAPEKIANRLENSLVNNPSHCRTVNFKLFGDGLITLPKLKRSKNCFSEVMANVLSLVGMT